MKILIPDIGDFKDVAVIEVLAAVGDSVAAEQSLLTLESDKATMEVPSPSAGRIVAVHVKPGDRVSAGTHIADLESDSQPAADSDSHSRAESKSESAAAAGIQNGIQAATARRRPGSANARHWRF